MSELVQGIKNGEIVSTSTASTASTTSNDSLGKDAFLQLLVTQMKYQDPLNPNTDTEFVAQLATFSQLEQMQNLTQTSSNSQAYGLVGSYVTVKVLDSSGNTSLKSGTVDFATMNNGKAQLYMNGSYYSLDQLDTVYDGTYVLKKGLPSIVDNVSATVDKAEMKDITFNVNLGSGETVATDVAIIINSNVLDAKYVTLSGNKVTISKDAFADYEVGNYKASVVFNDALYTAASGKIDITIKDSNPKVDDGTVDGGSEDDGTVDGGTIDDDTVDGDSEDTGSVD